MTLHELIKKHGGLNAVARKAEISVASVWQYSTSTRWPLLNSGVRLAAALELTPNELCEVLRARQPKE
jgi:hypothetical protein